jgi:hypothetical protein
MAACRSNPDSWFARCRLAWLERQARRSGTINRSDLMRQFGISAAQASADFQAYQILNPGALYYDLCVKCYRWQPKCDLAISSAPWANFPA